MVYQYFQTHPVPLPEGLLWYQLCQNGWGFQVALQADSCRLWVTADIISPANHGYFTEYKKVWFSHMDSFPEDEEPYSDIAHATNAVLNVPNFAMPFTGRFGGLVVVEPPYHGTTEYMIIDAYTASLFVLPAGVTIQYFFGYVGNSSVPYGALKLSDETWALVLQNRLAILPDVDEGAEEVECTETRGDTLDMFHCHDELADASHFVPFMPILTAENMPQLPEGDDGIVERPCLTHLEHVSLDYFRTVSCGPDVVVQFGGRRGRAKGRPRSLRKPSRRSRRAKSTKRRTPRSKTPRRRRASRGRK